MSRAFIAFYMGDYARDTGHLSTLEHGAYFLLLQHCWVHGSIPLCQKERGLVTQVSPQQWRRMRTKINTFFDEHGRNKRATIEIEKAEKLSTRKKMAGHRGAEKRWRNHGYGHNGNHDYSHNGNHGYGIAIKKEDITTTTSAAAREDSAMEPAAKPVIPVTSELAATIQKKRWVGRC